MNRKWVMISILGLLAACDKPAVVETCRTPHLVQHAALDTYEGQRERVAICLKTAAYDLTRPGGPVAEAARSALDRCAPQEADAVAALKKSGPVWPWQRTLIHEELSHLASVAAIQARSIGCGKAPGDGPDTL